MKPLISGRATNPHLRPSFNQDPLPARFKDLLQQILVVEMAPADKCRCMMSPLAHFPRSGNAHWPEQLAFPPRGAGHDPIRPEQAATLMFAEWE